MSKTIYIIAILLTCIACNDTNEPDVNSMTGIKVGLKSVLNPDTPDDRISGLRIMAFDANSHVIRKNIYYPEVQLAPQITYPITTGTYDFVVIANETRDGIVNTALDAVLQMSELNTISLPAASFNNTDPIPMINAINDVEVLPGTEGVRAEGIHYQVWNIPLKRLAIRLDMLLGAHSGELSDFTGLTVANLPDRVPLFGTYSGTHTTTRTYTIAGNPGIFSPATVAGATWGVSVNRIILPSNSFTPKNQPERVINVMLNLDNSPYSPSCVIGFNEGQKDYTLPSNTHLKINGDIKYPMEVNIKPADWGMVNLDGNLYEHRTLTLSTVSASINARNTVRIYFSSNQSNVSIEPTGYTGTSGTTSFSVNSVFASLSGTSAPNLHYTSGTSEGYVDIYAAQTTSNNSNTYRIFFNANGLRRQLTVTMALNSLLAWSSIPFAGTFHRWNQTGERVINSSNTGAWTATLEYPTGTDAFVNLSNTRSLDPVLGTDNPGNAEQYPVEEISQSISGNGNVYFRVGMKGTLASPTTAPRYARVRVNYSGGTSYVYVRQGEEADYLMRPTDPITTEAPAPTRPKARRISAFNLTDPQKATGRVDRGERGYVFTDYPSQSGYIFRWSGTYAWYPGMAATDWVFVPHGNPWSNYSWETSPPGYHRPDDGSTTSFVTTASMSDPSAITNSESRQSFWANPTLGSGVSNTSNFKRGYYADGFFDRGKLKPLPGPGYNNHCVGSGTQIAYMGWIAFNEKPDSYASIFLPEGNILNPPSGILSPLLVSIYMTSSSSSPASMTAIIIDSGGSGSISVNGFYAEYGGSIRCVADE